MLKSVAFFYLLYNFLRLISKDIESKKFNNSLPKKLKSLFYRYGYESNFFKLNFIDAYTYRYKHIYQVLNQGLYVDNTHLVNYVSHTWNADFINLLNLSRQEKEVIHKCYLRSLPSHRSVIAEPIAKDMSVLIAGPLFSFDSFQPEVYDYLILNKPPPDYILEIFKGGIVIITGHEWGHANSQLISKLTKESKNITFYSAALGENIISHDALINYPRHPFGSVLMNLPRTLFASNILFGGSNFVVEGYDFLLSQHRHNPWYKKNVMNIGANPLWSIGRHDYMLSYLYCRSFFQTNPQYSGSTVEISKLNIEDVLNRLLKTYKKHRIKLYPFF
jgi:hypothetical protein